jgi:hypothetical protein
MVALPAAIDCTELIRSGPAMRARAMANDRFDPGPPVGAMFPDLDLPDQRGHPLGLHRERRGRQALVVFHRSAAW